MRPCSLVEPKASFSKVLLLKSEVLPLIGDDDGGCFNGKFPLWFLDMLSAVHTVPVYLFEGWIGWVSRFADETCSGSSKTVYLGDIPHLFHVVSSCHNNLAWSLRANIWVVNTPQPLSLEIWRTSKNQHLWGIQNSWLRFIENRHPLLIL